MNKTELILYKTQDSDIIEKKVVCRKSRHTTQKSKRI